MVPVAPTVLLFIGGLPGVLSLACEEECPNPLIKGASSLSAILALVRLPLRVSLIVYGL